MGGDDSCRSSFDKRTRLLPAGRNREASVSRFSVALCALVLVIAAATSTATTLSGSFTYAGQTVSSVFPDHTHGLAVAYNSSTTEWVYGTIDPVAGTYQISNLTSGSWFRTETYFLVLRDSTTLR